MPDLNPFHPLVIRRSDPSRLEIEWADGHATAYTARELRGLCPCAGCVSETTGRRTHDPATVAPDLTQGDLRFVGNYAIALRFSDGHDTGIYPFEFLRDHDPRA